MIALVNGDRLEGFITGLGDPILIDVGLDGPSQTLRVALERVEAVRLVTPPRAPRAPRLWFRDGTVLDVERVELADDGFLRLRTTWTRDGTPPAQVPLVDARAILFDAGALRALALLAPSRIETTTPRYVLPPPRVLDDDAALDLARIELRGPIIAHYPLPAGSRRFAAQVTMPSRARQWGDLEFVLRNDDVEIFRARLNATTPTATVNVAITGAELTIELTEGANGPIQDRVILDRAMLLVEERSRDGRK